VLIAMTVLGATMVAARGDDALPAPLEVHVGGRVRADLENGTFDYGWPAAYFEARFRGSSVDVLLDDPQNTLSIEIDGTQIARLKRPGKTTYQIRDLRDAEHIVRVAKLTESFSAYARFGGFRVPDAKNALSPPTRSRQIEFIGDSYTVGLSDLANKRTCAPAEIVDLTDSDASYGVLTAKYFKADYSIVAMSSRGLLRNYSGNDAPNNMQTYYGRTFPYDPDPKYVADPSWSPDVVVVGLGTNDFLAPLKDGEAWPDIEALHKAFIAAYSGFVARLRAAYPDALIVLTGIDGGAGAHGKDVRAVAEQTAANGDGRIIYIPFAGLTLGACNYHPDALDHKKMAATLIEAIERRADVWDITPQRAAR